MRADALVLISIVGAAACGDGKDAVEEARAAAAKEAAERAKEPSSAKTIRPPVANQAKLPCSQVVNPETFTTALAEAQPLTLGDVTPKKGDLAASCDLQRGGKKLTAAQQDALLKKEGRLGVLPGDVVCNIQLYCYGFEDPEHFRRKCKDDKQLDDETMGTYACRRVIAAGKFDMDVYRFFDEDTRCVIEVRGGPSNTDNDSVRICAKTARDNIGAAQIAVAP